MAWTATVTGAGGYLGMELVKQLLERGYTVKATVRSLGDRAKLAPLRVLGEALPGKLELVEADLLVPGSFDTAVAGSRFVFHTASPFFIEAADPAAELLAPALEGTKNVMSSAARHKATVCRVVLTSSCAAVKGSASADPPKNGKLYTEEDWNETSTLEREAYWVSKVQAERAAWEAAKEHGLDLVTILPEFIMGPPIAARTDSTSIGYFKAWVEGKAQKGAPVFADVRDVARAHLLAAETPSASGRYIVAASASTPPQLISTWLRERFPQFLFQEGEEDESKAVVESSRVQRELGLTLTPVQTTLLEMATVLVALGVAQPRPKPALPCNCAI